MHRTSRILLILLSFSIMACKQQMSEESRKAAREEMKNREIKQLSEAEIFAAGLEIGKSIVDTLRILMKTDVDLLPMQTVAEHFKVQISMVTASDDYPAESLEHQLLEAYLFSNENAMGLQDNIVQGAENRLWYTSPVVQRTSDTTKFVGMLLLKMATKEIVNSIEMDYGFMKN